MIDQNDIIADCEKLEALGKTQLPQETDDLMSHAAEKAFSSMLNVADLAENERTKLIILTGAAIKILNQINIYIKTFRSEDESKLMSLVACAKLCKSLDVTPEEISKLYDIAN